MVASEIQGYLKDENLVGFRLLSRAYSLSAMGEQDGTGRARLTFPVASPTARLAVLIDGQYVAILPEAPENGLLSEEAFISSPIPPRSGNLLR